MPNSAEASERHFVSMFIIVRTHNHPSRSPLTIHVFDGGQSVTFSCLELMTYKTIRLQAIQLEKCRRRLHSSNRRQSISKPGSDARQCVAIAIPPSETLSIKTSCTKYLSPTPASFSKLRHGVPDQANATPPPYASRCSVLKALLVSPVSWIPRLAFRASRAESPIVPCSSVYPILDSRNPSSSLLYTVLRKMG